MTDIIVGAWCATSDASPTVAQYLYDSRLGMCCVSVTGHGERVRIAMSRLSSDGVGTSVLWMTIGCGIPLRLLACMPTSSCGRHTSSAC